jgi:methylglutaconyl-CoA hydratase
MTTAVVALQTENGIATISLTRSEKRNAMNGQMVVELREALKNAALDPAVSVVMLQGDGSHFCAGADIYWMCDMARRSYDDNYQDALQLADLMYELYTLPKPTIVLAHGATMGGGLGLVAAADIAIGADDSTYGFSEVKIGLTPATISPYVIAAIGERLARYYFITGEAFDAATAQKNGLLHKVVPAATLTQQGMATAQQLMKNNLRAMVAAKKLVREIAEEPLNTTITRTTAGLLAKVRATPDAEEGLKAFIEKRPPRWLK